MFNMPIANIVEGPLERAVAYEMANQLLMQNFIFYCHNCHAFHLETDVTWDSLTAHIQTLLN